MNKRIYLTGVVLLLFLNACTKKQLVSAESPPPQQEIIHSEPNPEKAAQINVQLALSYLKEGQIARAKSKLNRAITLAPKLPEVHGAYGYFFEKIGENHAAEKSYLKAIALNDKGGVEHNNYGAFLCRQQRYRQAENEFLMAMKDWQYTATAKAYENAGLCLLQIPDKRGALFYFEKALRHDPKSEHALLELAYLRFENKEYAQAKQYLKQYQQDFPANDRTTSLENTLYFH